MDPPKQEVTISAEDSNTIFDVHFPGRLPGDVQFNRCTGQEKKSERAVKYFMAVEGCELHDRAEGRWRYPAVVKRWSRD